MRKKIGSVMLLAGSVLGLLCAGQRDNGTYSGENGISVVAAEAEAAAAGTGTEAADSGKEAPKTADSGKEAPAWEAGGAAAVFSGAVQAALDGQDVAADTVSGNAGVAAEGGTETPQDSADEDDNEYANLAIADVKKYVNVRSIPSTDGEIVGKIYDGAVAQILAVAGEENDWFQIISGSVEGYIKAEYFIYGDAAAQVIDEYVTRYACVQVTRLNVRKEPSVEAKRIGYVAKGEKIKILEDCGEWLKVRYMDEKEGYVAAEYVSVAEEFVYAKSIEEERAELEAQRALAQRQAESEQSAPESTTVTFPETTYTSNEELRKSIVEYAMQYLGNKYVHGGRSLESGTDCSGFTCYIYAEFGYSISRTPEGQYSNAGRSISYEEIQPGDIICYSSNGKKCTHVALYIGDGQIIHAANSRKGVIISAADYDTIIGIRNVVD